MNIISLVSRTIIIPLALFIGVIPIESLTINAQKGAQPKSKNENKVPLEQITSVVRNQFGPKVRVSTSSEPFYLLGDFNGDGFSDIAVLINIEEGREDLKSFGVKYINVDPYSRTNGSESDPVSGMGHNCLGIAVIHGTADGWETNSPSAKYVFYECFSGFRVIRKGERIRRGTGSRVQTPLPKGDSIQIDLESGGAALIYWNGKTYRGFGQRAGD